MKRLGVVIKGIREERGIGLRRFAELVGSDPGNWSRFEKGETVLVNRLPRVLAELGVKLNEPEWHKCFRLYIYEQLDKSGQQYIDEHVAGWLEG